MNAFFSDSRPKPHYWDDATRHLMRRDRILKRLIPRHTNEWLHAPGPAFATLARIVISQQLSTRAAAEVWQRFVSACGAEPSPESVRQAASAADGLACLPRRKATYVLGLADHFADDDNVDTAAWQSMDNETVIADLCRIRGVGRWTAEMFLIFNLQRPDVLPLDDASLIKAISLHYFSGEPVSRFEAREVAQAWAPWRTVAAWHLWRSLDPAAVRY